jgi:MFS family permease
MALIGHFVEEPYRARASGLNQVTGNLAIVVGPALGTLLFLRLGISWALLTDSLSFAVSFLTIGIIHTPGTASLDGGPTLRPSFRGEFLEGRGSCVLTDDEWGFHTFHCTWWLSGQYGAP